MKIKMWCLVNKENDSIIRNSVDSPRSGKWVEVVGFATKKDLIDAIGQPEYDEEIRKIEMVL